MKHCTTVLKALFSNVSMSMGTVEKMEEYEKVVEAREDKTFTNLVIRSWNEVREMGKSRMDEGDLDFAVNELTKLDNVFMTHFDEAKYFKTTMDTWLDMWDQYLEAGEKYANTVAQRSGLTEHRAKIAEGMVGKLKFLMTNTDVAMTMPSLPLLTSGMLTVMIQSIWVTEDSRIGVGL